jgi:hypothetical protein
LALTLHARQHRTVPAGAARPPARHGDRRPARVDGLLFAARALTSPFRRRIGLSSALLGPAGSVPTRCGRACGVRPTRHAGVHGWNRHASRRDVPHLACGRAARSMQRTTNTMRRATNHMQRTTRSMRHTALACDMQQALARRRRRRLRRYIAETFETCCTWRDWPRMHAAVVLVHAPRTGNKRLEFSSASASRDRDRIHAKVHAVEAALRSHCAGGRITCRITHCYADGPAPYYTVPRHTPGYRAVLNGTAPYYTVSRCTTRYPRPLTWRLRAGFAALNPSDRTQPRWVPWGAASDRKAPLVLPPELRGRAQHSTVKRSTAQYSVACRMPGGPTVAPPASLCAR